MPITKFQKEVLLLLKASRNPESYVAGGTAIQRQENSLRYSNDIDFFHDSDEAVTTAYNADRTTLLQSHYNVETHIAQPSFYRATIAKANAQLKLEWVRDTAFRFFPVLEDADFGYRLHDVDLAINKCLALANRSEIRDALDIIELNSNVLSLAGMVWAACGKDPGFTPSLMLDLMQRHSVFTPDLLAAEALTRKVDARQLKTEFTALISQAKKTLATLKTKEMGCVFIDDSGNVVKDLSRFNPKRHLPHYGSVKGSWPKVVGS